MWQPDLPLPLLHSSGQEGSGARDSTVRSYRIGVAWDGGQGERHSESARAGERRRGNRREERARADPLFSRALARPHGSSSTFFQANGRLLSPSPFSKKDNLAAPPAGSLRSRQHPKRQKKQRSRARMALSMRSARAAASRTAVSQRRVVCMVSLDARYLSRASRGNGAEEGESEWRLRSFNAVRARSKSGEATLLRAGPSCALPSRPPARSRGLGMRHRQCMLSAHRTRVGMACGRGERTVAQGVAPLCSALLECTLSIPSASFARRRPRPLAPKSYARRAPGTPSGRPATR